MVDIKNAKQYSGLLLALAGALLFVSLFGHMNFNIEALQFRVDVSINEWGYTAIEFPPLGTVRAKTHATPVLISASLVNIDLELVKRLLAEPPERNEVIRKGRYVIRQVITAFILKLLVLALLGGAFGVFLTRSRSLRRYLIGAGSGGLLVGMLLLATYYTYDAGAFRNPQYFGVLRAAPWMVSLAQETLGKIETLGEKLELVAGNVNRLYERVEELQPLAETAGEFRILHISDLHNNPAGMDFVLRVADLFAVDMIIDTGDTSDFGTPLETLLLDRLKQLKKPYYFIAGNHDSPAVIDKMNSISGVSVINGLVEVNGLRLYGVPDPASAGYSVIPPDLSALSRLAGQIKDWLDQITPPVDILAVHNDKLARSLAGQAPVILCGHNHRLAVEEKDGSILINAGTSGASGFRGLQTVKIPYSVVLLYFLPDPAGGKLKLKAVDAISVDNLKQGFTLERKIFNAKQTGGQKTTPAG